MRTPLGVMICCVGMAALSGCYSIDQPDPIAVPTPEIEAPRVERWIKVDKSERKLWLYDGDQIMREYPIVLGADPYWPKLHEGDKRTPEGEYRILKKYPHRYWSRFLLLDYPTPFNEEIYEWSRTHGVLPRRGGRVPGIGSAIGIHGAEDESKNRRGIDWTLGCISLFNRDVDELYDLVPEGTRVLIQR